MKELKVGDKVILKSRYYFSSLYIGKEFTVISKMYFDKEPIRYTLENKNGKTQFYQSDWGYDKCFRPVLTLRERLTNFLNLHLSLFLVFLKSFFKDMKNTLKPSKHKLYNLGHYLSPKMKIEHDLTEYFIDDQGDMYSRNDDTYFTKYGQRLTKLSNDSFNTAGALVNSLRDNRGSARGRKITLRREKVIKWRDAGLLREVDSASL